MSAFELTISFGLLLLAEWLYIRFARRLAIVDRPNHRTMHTGAVVRGGGVIFSPAFLFYSFSQPLQRLNYFLLGLILLTIVSYLDDLKDIGSRVRLFAQFSAVILMFVELNLFSSWPMLLVLFSLIVTAGILNAFNFMDGINGITGGYALSILIALIFIDQNIVDFADTNLLTIVLLSVLAFGVFNFRKKALCFAGDVGSITLGFIICYWIICLIQATESFIWILLLMVYGIDAVITIIQRLKNSENIFDAHKKHLFQIAVYKARKSHLVVSAMFSFTQLIIAVFVVLIYVNQPDHQLLWSALLLLLGVTVYISLKYKINGSIWLSE